MASDTFPADLPAPPLSPAEVHREIAALGNVAHGSVLSVVATADGERVGYLTVTTDDGRRWRVRWNPEDSDGWVVGLRTSAP